MAENHIAEFDRSEHEFERSAGVLQSVLYENLTLADETGSVPAADECVRRFNQSLDKSLEHLGAVLSDPSEREKITGRARCMYEDDCYSGTDCVNEASDFLRNARVLLGLDRSAGEQALIREGEREFDLRFGFFHLEEKRDLLGKKLKSLISGLSAEQRECFLKQLKYPSQIIETYEISSCDMLLQSLERAELTVLYLYYVIYRAVVQNFDLGCYQIHEMSSEGVLVYLHTAAGGGGFAPSFSVHITDNLECEIHAVNDRLCRSFAQAVQIGAEFYGARLCVRTKEQEYV